ncbi:DNA topoisomerase 2-binding protein 1 [Manis javanica]|nr:DNA topoisomerase 2-binding protein 1 [Manis javanica]
MLTPRLPPQMPMLSHRVVEDQGLSQGKSSAGCQGFCETRGGRKAARSCDHGPLSQLRGLPQTRPRTDISSIQTPVTFRSSPGASITPVVLLRTQ